MADRELKKLNRKQLLELLLRLTERSEELQAQLDDANKKLKNRLLIKTEAGSIAEAALKLNGVFEAAEDAAKQYLYNVKKLNDNQDILKKRFEEECMKRAKAMFAEVDRRCAEKEEQSQRVAEQIIRDAQKRAEKIDEQANAKLDEIRGLYRYLSEEKKKLQKNQSEVKYR